MNETIQSVVLRKVRYILSEERLDDWGAIKEGIGDPAISALADSFIMREMRAMYIQLLGGAYMFALGGPIALISKAKEVTVLHELVDAEFASYEDAAQIKERYAVYNKAYGSSSTNGVGIIIEELSKVCSATGLSLQAKMSLKSFMTAVWIGMYNDLSRFAPHKKMLIYKISST